MKLMKTKKKWMRLYSRSAKMKPIGQWPLRLWQPFQWYYSKNNGIVQFYPSKRGTFAKIQIHLDCTAKENSQLLFSRQHKKNVEIFHQFLLTFFMNGIRMLFNAANNQQRPEFFWLVNGLPSDSTLYVKTCWVFSNTLRDNAASNGSIREQTFWAKTFFSHL